MGEQERLSNLYALLFFVIAIVSGIAMFAQVSSLCHLHSKKGLLREGQKGNFGYLLEIFILK